MEISKSNIKFNLSKSHGSYIYDDNRECEFLDLMSMYSSLPLGYNHYVFDDKKYINSILEYSKVKTCNCEYNTEERELFEKEFLDFVNVKKYDFVHFASTGALSVEMAIKAAIDFSKKPEGKVVYFEKSFHGILGYSNFITDRIGSTKDRLDGFINYNWIKVSNSEELEFVLSSDSNISCVIIEPIRCTQGDLYYEESELDSIYSICKKYSVITVTDEIQTGFGATGNIWYTNDKSDIIVFGKKSQVSGFLTSKKIGSTLNPIRYCVTWDGDVLDMIRSRYIIKTINKDDLLSNVNQLGNYFLSELSRIEGIKNVRGKGFIIAFDMDNKEKRDYFYKRCIENKLLVNLTGEVSIRLRPNLCIDKKTIDESLQRIKDSL